jgi:hypothetical protein
VATYKFKDLTNNEVFETTMSVHDLDKYKAENPQYHQLLAGGGFVSDLASTNKVPDSFRDLLGSIHRNTPGSTIGEHHN